jgi:DNA mismatch repair protein MutL
MLAPPSVITLTGREEGALHTHEQVFASMGYEIEPLGGSSYAIRAVPMELYGNDATELLRDTLEEMVEEKMNGTPAAILAKVASMSCKAAVKGNTILSTNEAEALIEELLGLDNPYHCPHGRPTMIVFSQSDMDKKFKRIVT